MSLRSRPRSPFHPAVLVGRGGPPPRDRHRSGPRSPSESVRSYRSSSGNPAELALHVDPENVHEILRARHYAERLVSAAILELAHYELRRVDADRRQLAKSPVGLGDER